MTNAKPCQYCGNNPTPHAQAWYFESVNILFAPLRRGLLYNPVARFFRWLWQKGRLSIGLTNFFLGLHVLSYQTDMLKCKVERAIVLWEEARRRGIVMKELLLFGKPFDCYVAEKPGTHALKIVFSGLPRPIGYDDSVLEILDDKAELKKIFKRAGLPVPAGGSAATFGRAREIFRSIQKPAIVKPRAGSRGRHSTTYVRTEAELKSAYKIAKALCFWVMVEEHIEGPVYRATVIDYKIRGVLRGDAPFVSGDGSHSIRQLVALKNSQPHEGVKDIILNDRSEQFLKRRLGTAPKDLSPLDFIPGDREAVELSEKIGISYGGSSSEDFSICHQDNKQLFEAAGRAAGDPIVGFDFIIPDISRSYKTQRCGFIEANSLPFINLHHHPLLGKPENVAAAVWDLVGF